MANVVAEKLEIISQSSETNESHKSTTGLTAKLVHQQSPSPSSFVSYSTSSTENVKTIAAPMPPKPNRQLRNDAEDAMSENGDYESGGGQPWTEVRRTSGSRQGQKKRFKGATVNTDWPHYSNRFHRDLNYQQHHHHNHHRNNHRNNPDTCDDVNSKVNHSPGRVEKDGFTKNAPDAIGGKGQHSDNSSPVPSISPDDHLPNGLAVDEASASDASNQLSNSQTVCNHRYNDSRHNRTFPRHSQKPQPYRISSNPDMDECVHSRHSSSPISNFGSNSTTITNNGTNYSNRMNTSRAAHVINRSSTINGPMCNHTNGKMVLPQQPHVNQQWRPRLSNMNNGGNGRRQPFGSRMSQTTGGPNGVNNGTVPTGTNAPLLNNSNNNQNQNQFYRHNHYHHHHHHYPPPHHHTHAQRPYSNGTNNYNRRRNSLSQVSSPSPPLSAQRPLPSTESQLAKKTEDTAVLPIETTSATLESTTVTTTTVDSKIDCPQDNPDPQNGTSLPAQQRTSWAATVAACPRQQSAMDKGISNVSNEAASDTSSPTGHVQLAHFLLDQWHHFERHCSIRR